MNVHNVDSLVHLTRAQLSHQFAEAQKYFANRQFDEAVALSGKVASSVPHVCKVSNLKETQKISYSIIVVTYGKSKDFINLLENIFSLTNGSDFELIVVNNGNNHVHNYNYGNNDVSIIDVGFNYGCCGARNIGVHFSSGKYVLFLDDDGLISVSSLKSIISNIESTGAVTVRGKVLPKTSEGAAAEGYDKGAILTPSIPDAEGISVWNKEYFLRFGGFDPLLNGHEGVMLFCKMYKFFGPEAFLYDPKTILFHDYLPTKERSEQRKKFQKLADEYFSHIGIDKHNSIQTFYRFNKNTRESALYKFSPFMNITTTNSSNERVSIITTAKNASPFLADYTLSLKQQTHQNYEVIFVDDGSNDGTENLIKDLWKGDNRFLLLKTDSGRAGALNIALENANEDICVIADVDDISIPTRLEWTLDYFRESPQSGCVSFSYFNERTAYGWGRPVATDLARIKARALFGMPVPFPAFGFRRSKFSLSFSPILAGIDCDWIFKNIRKGIPDGHYISRNAVYYRVHDKQISASKRQLQQEVVLRCIKEFHSDFLNSDELPDALSIGILSGWKRPKGTAEIEQTRIYIERLAQAIKFSFGSDNDCLLSALHFRVIEISNEFKSSSNIRYVKPARQTGRFKYISKTYWKNRRKNFYISLLKRIEKNI